MYKNQPINSFCDQYCLFYAYKMQKWIWYGHNNKEINLQYYVLSFVKKKILLWSILWMSITTKMFKVLKNQIWLYKVLVVIN